MSELTMTRDEAFELLRQHLSNENLLKHCLASEAIMRAMARRLGEDEDLWGLAGLLHDLDFEETQDSPTRHGLITAEVLESRGLPAELVSAVKEHNAEALGLERSSTFGIALACSETVSGIIVAVALVQPDKKLATVKASSVIKRMKKKDFARAVNRDIIVECERVGVPLDEFIALSVSAMQGISESLGL